MKKLKKYQLPLGLLVISIGFFLMGTLESCSSSNTNTAEEVEPQVEQEYLGIVGKGERGSFDVFRFKIDTTTYIVGSEYGGGMALIDKY